MPMNQQEQELHTAYSFLQKIIRRNLQSLFLRFFALTFVPSPITEEYKKNNNKRPSNEIQSILNLLFKNQSLDLDGSFWSEEREQEEDEEYIRDTIFKDFSPNLSHSYLKYADLIGANLYGSILYG